MDTKYYSNSSIVFDCTYHLIWCVKYRRNLLTGSVEERLKAICKDAAYEQGFILEAIECDGNHVHMLVNVDPQYGIHNAAKAMKGRSSKMLREEFPFLKSKLPTLWTNSYFVTTVGGKATYEQIKAYVENQKTSQRK
jgi:putative transposase